MNLGAANTNVLEVGTGIGPAFAGLILANQGATVSQVRSGLERTLDEFEQAYFDRLRTPVGSDDASRLASEAGLILTDLDDAKLQALGLPLSEATLKEGQILVRLSPFGLSGPNADFVSSDIVEWAAGGLAYVTRRTVPDDDEENYWPVLAPAQQPQMLGGLAAALASFYGIYVRRNGGEPLVLDVSRQEVQTAMLHGIVPPFVWNGVTLGSPSSRLSNIGMLLPAADGQIYFRTVEPHHWTAFVEWMGTPEWTQEDWARDAQSRNANFEVVKALVGEWSSQRPRQQMFEEGQARGVPVALPRSLDEVLASGHLAERNAWTTLETPRGEAKAPRIPLVESVQTAASASEKQAQAGERREDLRGVRVLDMGWSWAGPYAGMILADLGADVIKLESAGRIDILRWSGAFADGIRDYERSGYYGACNRGKKSFQMNLRHPDSRETLLRLVEQCDVLIENFAPRVMGKLGLDPETLRERNPRLIQLSMSGYGASGPERDYLSYGDHLLHASGMASITGFESDPDTKIGIYYGDPVGGMYGAMAVLSALNERELTGCGTRLELSQLEGLLSLLPVDLLKASVGIEPRRRGNRSDRVAPQGYYRCAGADTWVAIAATTNEQWQALRGILGDAGIAVETFATLQERQANHDAIDAAIGEWTGNRSPWQVTEACQRAGIPAYPVMPAPRLLWDKHLHERKFFQFVDRPITGPHPVTGPVFRAANGSSTVRGYAPVLGEHNEDVYGGILGFSSEEIARAKADQLIH